MEKTKVRKVCFVPDCNANTENSPLKLFIRLPAGVEIRKLWAESVGRRGKETIFHASSRVYCCEDHFNLPQDIVNYEYVRSMGGKIKLRPGTLPRINSEWVCQDIVCEKPPMAPVEYTTTLNEDSLTNISMHTITSNVDECLGNVVLSSELEWSGTFKSEHDITDTLFASSNEANDLPSSSRIPTNIEYRDIGIQCNLNAEKPQVSNTGTNTDELLLPCPISTSLMEMSPVTESSSPSGVSDAVHINPMSTTMPSTDENMGHIWSYEMIPMSFDTWSFDMRESIASDDFKHTNFQHMELCIE